MRGEQRGRKGIKEQTEGLKSRAAVSKSDYKEHKSCHRTSRGLGLCEEAGGFKESSFLRTGSGPAGGSSQAEVWAGGLPWPQGNKPLQKLQVGIKFSRNKSEGEPPK